MPRKSKAKKAPAVPTVSGVSFTTPAPGPAPPRWAASGVGVAPAPAPAAKVAPVAPTPVASDTPVDVTPVAVVPAPVLAQNTTTIAPVNTTTSTPHCGTAPTFLSALEAFSDLFADSFSLDNTMISTGTKAESLGSSIHSSEFDTAIEIVPTIYPFPPPAPEAPILDYFGLAWPHDVPKALENCQLFGPGGDVDCPLLTTPFQIAHLIDILQSATHPLTHSSISPGGEPLPTLFLDLEGTSLSRHGSISILQICVQKELPTASPADKNSGGGPGGEYGWPEERRGGVWPKGNFASVDEFAMKWAKVNYPSKEEREKAGKVYLIDVHTLGDLAFSTVGIENPNVTLKSILEDMTIPKVFFDVRNDSNALYFLYNIKLQGIHDLQVMQAATKHGPFILGLGKCIANNLHIPDRKVHRLTEPFIDSALNDNEIKAVDGISKRGKAAFAPELGGSYSVFLERPLAREMLHYCITDVVLMPAIYARLRHSLDTWDKNNVVKAVDRQGTTIQIGEYVFNMLNVSESRVFVSQLEGYDPKSRSKVLNPWQTLRNHNEELDISSSSRGYRGGLGGGGGRGRGRGRGRGHGRGRGRGGRGGSEVPAEVIQPWDFSDGVEWVKFARPAATVEER